MQYTSITKKLITATAKKTKTRKISLKTDKKIPKLQCHNVATNSASEVTTLWRYTNLFIIIIITGIFIIKCYPISNNRRIAS